MTPPSPREDANADAEAAAWIARLQSPRRDSATEAALQSWLGDSAARRDAFERATEIWAMIPGATGHRAGPSDEDASAPARGASLSSYPVALRALALAASLLVMVCSLAWWAAHRPTSYVTARGEQEVATLTDGSRIALDTDTRLAVDYRRDIRRITLDHGEAMFDVAHNTKRPFIVFAGDKRVRAVGTSFIVRRIDGNVEVTLLRGKVEVTQVARGRTATDGTKPTVLVPGERLIADKDAPAAIDTPAIDTVTAWRRGQIVFDETPLSGAIAQLERYGGPQVTVPDPRLAAVPVSGVFSTNDTAEFAAAVARLHGWRVVRDGRQLQIEE
ncbi:MAG: FecR family protein [Sphingomonas sp.]